MTRLLVDTSVLIKWFHTEGESEVAESRAIRDAHVSRDLEAFVLDLAVYEVGNVLLRALRWSATVVSDQLEDLLTIVGPPLTMAPAWLTDSAAIGEIHGLSFYDACWAATAANLNMPLVSADRKLIAAGVAETATEAAGRLRL